jgi:hypothetical protein
MGSQDNFPVSIAFLTGQNEPIGDKTRITSFPPKCQLTFNRHHSIISQKVEHSLFLVAPTLEHRASMKRFVSLQFLNLR